MDIQGEDLSSAYSLQMLRNSFGEIVFAGENEHNWITVESASVHLFGGMERGLRKGR